MIRLLSLSLLIFLFTNCQVKRDETITGKPTLYIIGDSTVKNGRGDGARGLWGWGDPIQQYFDTTKIDIENHALGGTSSRSFRSKGLWDEVLRKIQPGDYVLMQFGHNDNGPINDTIRARGTFKGIGEETEEIDNMLTGEHEIVHSYGWYMRQYIIEAKQKGAVPVVVAPIPRNDWKDGKIIRNDDSYGKWAKEVAELEEVPFINLNEKMAAVLDTIGQEKVTGTYFFDWDHTHTSAKGASLSASKVVEGLKELDNCWLKDYLLANPVINFPVKKKVFIIGDSTVANGDGTIVGWGRELPSFFDTTRVEIINKARGGRSSRSYRYEGLWDEVLEQMGKGDFLLIQFGHNDGGNIDQPKYRGSLQGMGEETQEAHRDSAGIEVVHTYGWYMKKYISEAKAKGATSIVISMIPRNIWKDGKVERATGSYGDWAAEAAQAEGAFFINLNEEVAEEYEAMGPDIVKKFFPKDHTHTNDAGARLNALTLAKEIKDLRDCPLYGYVEIPRN
ncbi:rhamnogalacturonan acetylesterase [Mangrovibacterium diazotrophicum]|uniref:Lysophospholipase L1-like esterase n=1 Tax=Mangrovibacterium diazotrophicum TaxID=1261403 RepID=A0A419WAZ2_9BACT|nr:rhamnogalacturonan acetylesterase [Mangrovibacterium diazotrophicum]RKD92609.1 lysophospholipase L1-like esterase [Mangrovibacterium diazotrophicum]